MGADVRESVLLQQSTLDEKSGSLAHCEKSGSLAQCECLVRFAQVW